MLEMSANYQKEWRLKTRMEEEFLRDCEEEMTCSDLSEGSSESEHETSGVSENEPDNISPLDDTIPTDDEDPREAGSQDSSSSSSEEEFDFDFHDERPLLNDKLRDWACKFNCTRGEIGDLLKILRDYGHEELPKDPRTLLKTPR